VFSQDDIPTGRLQALANLKISGTSMNGWSIRRLLVTENCQFLGRSTSQWGKSHLHTHVGRQWETSTFLLARAIRRNTPPLVLALVIIPSQK
jgi:hypothetical protein